MDEVFQTFFSAQTIFLCLGIYVITFVMRKVIETWKPKVRFNRWWREIFVPIGPIVNGALLGLMKNIAWPDMLGESLGGRMLYGAICGLFSAFIYNRIRAWMKSKTDPSAVAAPAAEDNSNEGLPMIESLPPMSDETKSDEPKG